MMLTTAIETLTNTETGTRSRVLCDKPYYLVWGGVWWQLWSWKRYWVLRVLWNLEDNAESSAGGRCTAYKVPEWCLRLSKILPRPFMWYFLLETTKEKPLLNWDNWCYQLDLRNWHNLKTNKQKPPASARMINLRVSPPDQHTEAVVHDGANAAAHVGSWTWVCVSFPSCISFEGIKGHREQLRLGTVTGKPRPLVNVQPQLK